MNEQEVNKVIAGWLGLLKKEELSSGYIIENYFDFNNNPFIPDFLHDRNQQKWIEDELEKKKYTIKYYSSIDDDGYFWTVEIRDSKNKLISHGIHDSKDQAFIDAVMELIEKERTK